MLVSIALAAALAPQPAQTIDGIKPVDDGTVRFAKAVVAWIVEEEAPPKADPFALGYFGWRAKMMVPLRQTKYTAAHVGLCGTVLATHHPELAKAIKSAADRIARGPNDFDSFTEEERTGVEESFAAASSPHADYLFGKATKESHWLYFAGAYAGTLSAYTTLWHLSPRQPILLDFLEKALKSAASHGLHAEGAARKPLADALKALQAVQGKPLNEATIRLIGEKIERATRAAVPAKHQWAVPAR